jgi:hypothetical protein
MRVVIVTCDRCGSTITGPMSTLAVAGELAGTIERVDLCQPCGRALVDWLRAAHTPRGEALAPPADGSRPGPATPRRGL